MVEIDRDGVRLGFGHVASRENLLCWCMDGGCNRMYFKPQVDALSAHRRVISLDLRGHGTSDAPEQERWPHSFGQYSGIFKLNVRAAADLIPGSVTLIRTDGSYLERTRCSPV